MSPTTPPVRTRTDREVLPEVARVVEPGTLADVTAAARLVQPPLVTGADTSEQEALVRLALAHLALTSGGLWVLRREGSPGALVSAAALLPPGSHPDVAAMTWMARVQLDLRPRPGGDPGEALLLLPPRRGAHAAQLVDAALASTAAQGPAAGRGGDPGARDVVAPVPGHPVVAAVLRERGFTADAVPGLLRLR